MASERNYIEIVAFLLSQNVDITGNADKLQPIHLATAKRNPEILDMLLNEGADINAKDHEGRTPLDWATYYRDKKAIKYLLEKGGRLGDSL